MLQNQINSFENDKNRASLSIDIHKILKTRNISTTIKRIILMSANLNILKVL